MADHRVAKYYTEKNGRVICQLCPHYCQLRPDQMGICRVRFHQDGVLKTMTYGQISSIAIDPIEKKPLYHFYPGSLILSVGSFGCNLSCPWCQNHHIACTIPPTRYMDADELASLALEAKVQGSIGLAYTYNEPTMAYEFIADCAELVQRQGLKNVLVTNGYINPEPLAVLLKMIDALNIDLKGVTPSSYRRYCKGKMEPVWDIIELAASLSHVEVTTLVIPELNDDPVPFREASRRLSQINPDIPWHLSAFYPAHRFHNRPPTPAQTLYQLRDIAREYMNYVYLGNLGSEDNDTRCPHCGQTLIKREGYRVKITGLAGKRCTNCEQPIPIAQ